MERIHLFSLCLSLSQSDYPHYPYTSVQKSMDRKGGLVKKLEQIRKEYYWNEKNKIYQRIELKEKMGEIGSFV